MLQGKGTYHRKLTYTYGTWKISLRKRPLTYKECLELPKEREKGRALQAARSRCAKVLWWDRSWLVKDV